MTYGRKTGGKDFKPGEVNNPKGRPKTLEDLKQARKLNRIEVSRIINKYMNMSIDQITEETKSVFTTALEAMIGKIIVKANEQGDYSRVNFLFDRMIGKVTEKVEVKLPRPTVIKLIGEQAAIVLGNKQETDDDE